MLTFLIFRKIQPRCSYKTVRYIIMKRKEYADLSVRDFRSYTVSKKGQQLLLFPIPERRSGERPIEETAEWL